MDVLVLVHYHGPLATIPVLGRDIALGHTLLPRDGGTTPLPLIEGMQAIQDLLEVLHQSEMVTTAAGLILQLMAMAMILMKMAMGLARNQHMILRKHELGGRHLEEHQGHLLDQDLGRLTCHQGILDKANEVESSLWS